MVGSVRPYSNPSKNTYELVNEVNLYFVMYTFLVFSDFVSDLGAKLAIGYVSIAFVVFNLVFNFSLMLKESIWKLRLSHARWKHGKNNAKTESSKVSDAKTETEAVVGMDISALQSSFKLNPRNELVMATSQLSIVKEEPEDC